MSCSGVYLYSLSILVEHLVLGQGRAHSKRLCTGFALFSPLPNIKYPVACDPKGNFAGSHHYGDADVPWRECGSKSAVKSCA